MDLHRLQREIECTWTAEVMPALLEYIAIPCESPAFDPEWRTTGHIERAVGLLTAWASAKLSAVPGATVGERFPRAQFVVTGVLGPHSNAHGPNEFLHLPTAKRITAVLGQLLADAYKAESSSTAAYLSRSRSSI